MLPLFHSCKKKFRTTMKAPRQFGGEGPCSVFTALGLEKQTGTSTQPLSRILPPHAGWPTAPQPVASPTRSPSRFCKGQMLSAFTLSSLVAEKVHPLAPISFPILTLCVYQQQKAGYTYIPNQNDGSDEQNELKYDLWDFDHGKIKLSIEWESSFQRNTQHLVLDGFT